MTRRYLTAAHAKRTARSRFALAALAAGLAVVALTGTACSQSSTPSASQSTAPAETQSTVPTPTDTGAATAPAPAPAPEEKLKIKDLKVGKGAAAKAGDNVTVEYTGWLMDGTKFDSNVGGTPIPVTIGAGQVIAGWDQGLVGLKVGGTRTLIIPPSLGYGAQGSPPQIPANATLKFDVKLISLTPGQ